MTHGEHGAVLGNEDQALTIGGWREVDERSGQPSLTEITEVLGITERMNCSVGLDDPVSLTIGGAGDGHRLTGCFGIIDRTEVPGGAELLHIPPTIEQVEPLAIGRALNVDDPVEFDVA